MPHTGVNRNDLLGARDEHDFSLLYANNKIPHGRRFMAISRTGRIGGTFLAGVWRLGHYGGECLEWLLSSIESCIQFVVYTASVALANSNTNLLLPIALVAETWFVSTFPSLSLFRHSINTVHLVICLLAWPHFSGPSFGLGEEKMRGPGGRI